MQLLVTETRCKASPVSGFGENGDDSFTLVYNQLGNKPGTKAASGWALPRHSLLCMEACPALEQLAGLRELFPGEGAVPGPL